MDLVLAGVCALLSIIALNGVSFAQGGSVSGSRWWTVPLFLMPAAALLLRRTSPVICVIGVFVPIALHAVVTDVAAEGLFLVVPGWASLYALAAYGCRRQLFAGLSVAVACLVVHDVNDPTAWRTGAESAWSAAFWNLLLFLPALAGGWVGGVRRSRLLAKEKADLEKSHHEQALAAVEAERARIARELHDAVTHKMNIVLLQAMAASGVLSDDPSRVREPLDVIERSAREALEEMRQMLGVLRDHGEESDVPVGPPGVDDLEGLLVGARESGLTVQIAVEGEPRRLPSAMGLTLYRIVQESLSNAARHAARSRVVVRLGYEEDSVDLSVLDDGGGMSTSASGLDREQAGAGLGLVGMRERVAAFGGELHTGPVAGGGFAVHARLPARSEVL